MKQSGAAKRIGCAYLCLGLVLAAGGGFAQTTRSSPIRIVLPVLPGGIADASMRRLAPKMGEVLGQPIVIENQPGAGGIIGMAEVARSLPDGQTLLYYNDAVALIPFVFAKPGFDTLKDFSPITETLSVPFALFVHPSIPANTLQELVSYSKANPGKLNGTSGGAGTVSHLFFETFKSVSGADMQHIPYKSASQALTDFIAGQVQVFAISTTLGAPQVRAGKAKALAVAAGRRAAILPGVPTTAEAGYPGMEFTTWLGFFGPAHKTEGTVQRTYDAASRALKDPATLEFFTDRGFDVLGSTPAAFRRFVVSENAKFGKAAVAAGIKPE